MKHCIVTFICFPEQSILNICLWFRKVQKAAMHQIAWLYYFFQKLFLRETIVSSIS